MLAQLHEELRGGPPLLLGVARPRALVADPQTVDSHLDDLLHGVLADGADAREGEDGERPSPAYRGIAKLQRPALVQEEVFVEHDEADLGI